MAYVNQYGKRYLVGDWIKMGDTSYQLMDFKLSGMLSVRTLGKNDEWVHRVLSPETLGLHWKD